MQSGSFLPIHDALRERGFDRIPSGDTNLYRGVLGQALPMIPVEISIRDLDFVTLPAIRLSKGWSPSRKLPHILGPDGAICYYVRGAIVLDRYDPAGTVIQCIDKAERVVRQAMQGRLDGDFAAEFGPYWGESWMLSDLPPDYVGPGTISFPRLAEGRKETPLLSNGSRGSLIAIRGCRTARQGSLQWSFLWMGL